MKCDEKEMDFTQDQMQEIEEGMRLGLDVAIYAKPEFLAIQMQQIRLALMENLPIKKYARTEYDWFQLEEIRKGMQEGLDVEKYADSTIPFDTMRQIRKGLSSGIDLSSNARLKAGVLKELRKSLLNNVNIIKYIKSGYDEGQLEQIRLAMEKGIDIGAYISNEFRGPSIQEICAGLERKIDVRLYAKPQLAWQQMREIRLGLEKRLEVGNYINPYYSWQQMQEIRLGLEENLPIETYSSLMYTAKEMKEKRHMLCQEKEKLRAGGSTVMETYKEVSVMVSADEMEAMVLLQQNTKVPDKESVLLALSKCGVVSGIDYEAIDFLTKNAETNQDFRAVVVANGCEPQAGKDGWYEYFFRTEVKKQPKLLEDGSVDYRNIEWFEIVEKGTKIAYYHSAEEGQEGFTVTGKRRDALKGKELKMLIGRGIVLNPDQKTYIAGVSGRIELKSDEIEITNLLVVDEINTSTGNMEFNGSVYIKGTVGSGSVVKASQDVFVEGFVESAVIQAGGDVVLKRGANGAGNGFIQAGRNVSGRFFESIRVQAAGNIKGNYCLNCELYAGNWIEISGRNGMLAGGNNYATVGIKACQIGNKANLPTALKVGMRADFIAEKRDVLEREKAVDREIHLLENAYSEFRKEYAPEVRNTNEIYLKLEKAIYTKKMEMEELLHKKERLEKEETVFKNAKVVINGMLFEGVFVEMNGATLNAKQVRCVTLKKKDNRIVMLR